MHTREKIGKFWLLSAASKYNYIKGKNGHSPTRAHALASAASEAGRGGAQMVATAVLTGCKPGTSPQNCFFSAAAFPATRKQQAREKYARIICTCQKKVVPLQRISKIDRI